MSVEFQALTWDSKDENGQYKINIFGKTEDGKSVFSKVDYNPRFYVEVPESWDSTTKEDFVSEIRNKLSRSCDVCGTMGFCSMNNKKCSGDTCYSCKSKVRYQIKRCKHYLGACNDRKFKKFYGFTNDAEFDFLELIFTNKASYTKMQYAIRRLRILEDRGVTKFDWYPREDLREILRIEHENLEAVDPKDADSEVSKKDILQNIETIKQRIKDDKTYGLEQYESNFDPMLKFCHNKHAPPAGWFGISDARIVPDEEKESYCDIEVHTTHQKVSKFENEKIAPFVVASFDIETYSPDGAFPDPEKDDCYVIQIGTTLQRYGEPEPYMKHLVCLRGCSPIEGVDVECYEREGDVLDAWARLLQRESVDILLGYNIWKFDLQYMYKRAKKTGANGFMGLGRLKNDYAILKKTQFSSSAYGDNDYEMVITTGMFQIDLLVIMQREHKLSSYKLQDVSEHFLNDKKVDLSPAEMFAKWRGSDEDRRDVGIYCVQDTNLPIKLVNKLAIIPNMVEMAKATWVPISFLIERGQGIKVFSQILYAATQENKLVLNKFKDPHQKQEEYEGATVLSAKKGAYMDVPITGLDFASLYPTIMMAHNLCHSTFVTDEKYVVEGVEYFEFEGHRFAQNIEGVLPKLLRSLAKNRKQAKKDMAKAKDDGDMFMYAVYNGKQLAFKVSMNSIYGFCGASVGALPCKPVAQTTTGVGRGMIEKTKTKVEEWYPGSDVVYGDTDSVMVKFNVSGKTGQAAIEESFRLGEEAAGRISATFKKPIELEFEKVYHPYLLFSKKRYAGLMYTNPAKSDYIDAKGIQLVRRDNCKMVRGVSKAILNIIMYDRDLPRAVKLVKDTSKRLMRGDINIMDLVVSKSLKRVQYIWKRVDHVTGVEEELDAPELKTEYKSLSQPHLTVARNIETRNRGSGPRSGERVPYVFVDTGNPKHKQFQKAEDPTYVKENNLPLDCKYYLEHSLLSPIESLFELFLENPKEELFGEFIPKKKTRAKKKMVIEV